jgi:hypothetical protein
LRTLSADTGTDDGAAPLVKPAEYFRFQYAWFVILPGAADELIGATADSGAAQAVVHAWRRQGSVFDRLTRDPKGLRTPRMLSYEVVRGSQDETWEQTFKLGRNTVITQRPSDTPAEPVDATFAALLGAASAYAPYSGTAWFDTSVQAVNCHDCRGRGQSSCAQCWLGRERCWRCNGAGGWPTSDYKGQETCPTCSGSREVTCRSCWGSGWLDCPACERSGWVRAVTSRRS